MGRIRPFVLVLIGAGLLLGQVWTGLAQTASSQMRDSAEGKALFHNEKDKEWTATGLTCNHCHADFNEKDMNKRRDDHMRTGHMLYNSGHRSTFHAWDGRELASLQGVVTLCMERWMTARDSTGSGKPAAKHHVRKILVYLQSEALSPERKSKPIKQMLTDELPGDRLLKVGDPGLGAAIFRRACMPCHASDGSGPAPSLVRNGYTRYQIAKKVRGIQNKGLNGLVMPPFARDRLSNRELINVVAFVYQM